MNVINGTIFPYNETHKRTSLDTFRHVFFRVLQIFLDVPEQFLHPSRKLGPRFRLMHNDRQGGLPLNGIGRLLSLLSRTDDEWSRYEQ